MVSINSLYKFYFDHPTQGSVQFFPLNNKLTWDFDADKDNFFFRKKLGTALKIEGDHFKMLHALERSKYRCDKVPVRIELKVNDVFEPYFNGYFALIDADEWNVDMCYVKIKPRLEDEYTCLLANWSKEKDIIGGEGAPSGFSITKYLGGELEIAKCSITIFYNDPNPIEKPPTTDCLDNPSLWTFIGYKYYGGGSFSSTRVSEFAREKIVSATEPLGGGWTNIGNNIWVRPIDVGSNNLATQKPLDNGRKLSDVLTYLVKDCELSLKSNFFSIGPQGDYPNNAAYKNAKQNLASVLMFQKSDVRRKVYKDASDNPLPHQPATKAIIKLKDLLDWLRVMFNVYWIIKDGFLIVEHLTYFKRGVQNMINLTHEDFDINIAGRYKYSYINQDLPITETFTWMEKTGEPLDFDGISIEYAPECSFEDDKANTKDYPVGKVTTNVQSIILSPDEISNDGFVFLATVNYEYPVIAKGEISGKFSINAPLSWANLQYYCHRDGRPQLRGKMNGKDEQFFNVKRSREQKDITVSMTEDDMLNFDPLHRVKTQLGWGEITKATIDAPLHKLKCQLIHEA